MDIYHALFWGCAAVVVIAELLILRATFAPPAGTTPTAPVSNGDSPVEYPEGNRPLPPARRSTELLWGILPAVALGAVLWAAWRALI